MPVESGYVGGPQGSYIGQDLKAAVAGGLLDGWQVVVLDVDGEYRVLC